MNFVGLPFYNIANMMFIGIQFCVGLFVLFPIPMDKFNNMIHTNTDSAFLFGVFALAIIYEVGIVIDRIASMVVEKILKTKRPKSKRGWFSRAFQITWKDYGHYQMAEKNNEAIKTLSREYNYSRNSLTMLLVLFVLGIAMQNWVFSIIVFDLAILFYMSMRKHANKIAQRVDFAFSKEQERIEKELRDISPPKKKKPQVPIDDDD